MFKMKKLFLMIITTILISCNSEPTPIGVTNQILAGTEQNLPNDIVGLKMYEVKTNSGWVKVGVMNNAVSMNYNVPSGKTTRNQPVIVVDHKTNKIIEIREILSENDSIIVCKKVMR